MSFSKEVKEELERQYGTARHCRLAELAVLIRSFGRVSILPDQTAELKFRTEHAGIARKYFTLLKKTFNIDTVVSEEGTKNKYFTVLLTEKDSCNRVLQAVKFMKPTGEIYVDREDVIPPILLKTQCCKRAFLRGIYLCNGSMSDPAKGYHMEFVCNNEAQAQQVLDIIGDFELEAKTVTRKNKQVVYLKEGEAVVELLNIMEAHRSLMNLENERILKDIRNRINRGVNCDAANIRRITEAASNQREDILYLFQHNAFSALPEGLHEVAMVRLENPDLSLKDIGALLDPPVGKSGVNHRLRKLSEVAERLRQEQGGK